MLCIKAWAIPKPSTVTSHAHLLSLPFSKEAKAGKEGNYCSRVQRRI